MQNIFAHLPQSLVVPRVVGARPGSPNRLPEQKSILQAAPGKGQTTKNQRPCPTYEASVSNLFPR
jgi:hypothetical protein